MNESEWRSLTAQARNVLTSAYAPYSKFRVGAALLAESGKIFVGTNVENASYGLTSCAERNAVAASIASGCRSWRALAIVSDAQTPITPCGACRQVLREFVADLPIVSVSANGSEARFSLAQLLPDAFSL